MEIFLNKISCGLYKKPVYNKIITPLNIIDEFYNVKKLIKLSESNFKVVYLCVDNNGFIIDKKSTHDKAMKEYNVARLIKNGLRVISVKNDSLFIKYYPLGDGIDFGRIYDYDNCYEKRLRLVLKYSLGIVEQIFNLHSSMLVHLDIKPDNILYSYKEDRFVIIDFEYVTSNTPQTNTKCVYKGTRNYMDPYLQTYKDTHDLFKTSPDLEKCDIYSLGVTLWVLLYKVYPFVEPSDPFQTYEDTVNKTGIHNDLFTNLLFRMLNREQYLRPNIRDVYRSIKAIYRYKYINHRWNHYDRFDYLNLFK